MGKTLQNLDQFQYAVFTYILDGLYNVKLNYLLTFGTQ